MTPAATSTPVPRLSIGLPVWNGAGVLERTIDSILAQTFADFELIICDNASTDETEMLCRRYAAVDGRVRYIRHETNIGAAPNFNACLDAARAEFFKWAPHDDPLEAEMLERCIAALDDAPANVALCTTDRYTMSHNGHRLGVDRNDFADITVGGTIRRAASHAPCFICGVARTEAVRRTRGMGSFPHADLVFITELRLEGPFVHVAEPLFSTRLHELTDEFVRDRVSTEGQAAWFDPEADRPSSMDRQLLDEYLGVIDRSALAGRARFAARASVRWLGLRRRAVPLRLLINRSWIRVSLAGAKASRRTVLPARLWTLAAGLKAADGDRIATAFAGPWFTPQVDVLSYVAARIAERRSKWGPEPRAEALLREWAAGESEPHRTAARAAMARHADRFGDQIAAMNVHESKSDHGEEFVEARA